MINKYKIFSKKLKVASNMDTLTKSMQLNMKGRNVKKKKKTCST